MTTILQIEDNQANRILVERVLTPHGLQLIQADTGEMGIQLAIERLPDLILIDIGLPDYDGHTVLSLLQQIPDLAHIPFVAITAWPADIAAQVIGGLRQWLAQSAVPDWSAMHYRALRSSNNFFN